MQPLSKYETSRGCLTVHDNWNCCLHRKDDKCDTRHRGMGQFYERHGVAGSRPFDSCDLMSDVSHFSVSIRN